MIDINMNVCFLVTLLLSSDDYISINYEVRSQDVGHFKTLFLFAIVILITV